MFEYDTCKHGYFVRSKLKYFGSDFTEVKRRNVGRMDSGWEAGRQAGRQGGPRQAGGSYRSGTVSWEISGLGGGERKIGTYYVIIMNYHPFTHHLSTIYCQ
jgi:hypothetical protein